MSIIALAGFLKMILHCKKTVVNKLPVACLAFKYCTVLYIIYSSCSVRDNTVCSSTRAFHATGCVMLSRHTCLPTRLARRVSSNKPVHSSISDFPHENLTVSFGRLFVLAAGPGTRLPPEHVLWVRPEHSETARGIN